MVVQIIPIRIHIPNRNNEGMVVYLAFGVGKARVQIFLCAGKEANFMDFIRGVPKIGWLMRVTTTSASYYIWAPPTTISRQPVVVVGTGQHRDEQKVCGYPSPTPKKVPLTRGPSLNPKEGATLVPTRSAQPWFGTTQPLVDPLRDIPLMAFLRLLSLHGLNRTSIPRITLGPFVEMQAWHGTDRLNKPRTGSDEDRSARPGPDRWAGSMN